MKNDFNIPKFEFGDMPNVPRIPRELLEELQEEGIRDMIDRFYDRLKVSKIKHLFPIHNDEVFKLAASHSADFFIQICGGKDYFTQNRGEPMMRRRHMQFFIDKKARAVWLSEFKTTIEETDMSSTTKQKFWDYLANFSQWMVNAK